MGKLFGAGLVTLVILIALPFAFIQIMGAEAGTAVAIWFVVGIALMGLGCVCFKAENAVGVIAGIIFVLLGGFIIFCQWENWMDSPSVVNNPYLSIEEQKEWQERLDREYAETHPGWVPPKRTYQYIGDPNYNPHRYNKN